ncbi:DsbA family protein [Cerasibacillus terrae]|uniref:ClpXP adapter protein SpxH n=2 Tax=Cerasibacillus terrae TaxID=2498845 RepID=A0A5C8NRX0_9BACI|nr:DsbA family protein [Cerasibacillus terrae]
MYVFVDPLCPECWSLEPYLRKLSLEYGRFFTIRPILSNYLSPVDRHTFHTPQKLKKIYERTAKRTGISCHTDTWDESKIKTPWIASLAIKAAELQGKRLGKIFLRKIQESLFLKKENITEKSVLMNCAETAGLDLEEFKSDLHSSPAKKALQCDIKLTTEMEIDYIPSIVFFNQKVDEQGIKVSGIYPYDIYVRILTEIMKTALIPSEKPPLQNFIEFYRVVSSKEVSIVYEWTLDKAERELKKLQLKQIVKRIPIKYDSFWKYQDK